ncbi:MULTISPECIES: alanyl-tRNA editing protein [Dictyoglomus]|jgi:alanyl-tRNA synthetase|uniref:Alanine--tRNA ligase n=1 Tax=Dictyoglomus turgidum (strain DSM 6724 / Z-1310) TaxID=515635 RepID=B8E0L2_DICTD|nr:MULTISPECIES: alanyl-tRNA editing protein [Dictyoglomus]ACK43032.1 Threonyl/alanyl tRNA synthetase SAD [Dictyoglomus turgidum DSM 6724]HBU31093.1 alanyl-tRNA editing protein [Dictyoglomus sp.]
MRTRKIYYEDSEIFNWKSRIEDIKQEGDFLLLSLDETIFYPEGGGQPSDRGEIVGEAWKLEVSKVFEKDGVIWHKGKIFGENFPKIGEIVDLFINIDLRREYMEQHTAQHLLSAILEKDYSLETTGFQVFEDHTKIEIPYKGLDPEGFIKEVEGKVNEYIGRNISISIYWKDESTRIVEIPGLDVNPCGGLHVKSLGELKLLKILDFYKKNNLYWRVEFVAGRRIIKQLEKREKEYKIIKEKLGNPNIVEGVDMLLSKADNLEKQIRKLKEELNSYRLEALLKETKEFKEYKFVARMMDLEIGDLKYVAQGLFVKDKVVGVLFNPQGQGFVFGRSVEKDLWNSILSFLFRNGWRGSKEGEFLQGKIENPKKVIEEIFLEFFKD